MKYIKTSIDDINIPKLRDYLTQQKDNYFDKDNKATSWEDFERFPGFGCNRNKLIMPGEYLMIDIYSSQLWICQHTNRVHKVEKDRKAIRFKPITCVIEDCHTMLGSVWNGYWLIPYLGDTKPSLRR